MFLSDTEYAHVIDLLDKKIKPEPLFSIQRQFRKGANYDSKKQLKIQIKFAELARKYNVHPEYHTEKDIFVCFDTIRDQIACKLLWEKRNEIYALQLLKL